MITRATALEIFTNPFDLALRVGQEEETGKYFLTICRGRNHNYKLLVDSSPCKETRDEILEFVEQIVRLAKDFCVNEIQWTKTEEALREDLILAIMQKLREHSTVDTFDLMPAQAA